MGGGRFDWNGPQRRQSWYVAKPESAGLQRIPTDHVRGYDYAGGDAWKAQDGTLYVTGSGRHIWGRVDDFNYYSEKVSGDHSLIVHIADFNAPHTDKYSRVQVMFRGSLDVDAPHASIGITGASLTTTVGMFSHTRLEKGGLTIGQGKNI